VQCCYHGVRSEQWLPADWLLPRHGVLRHSHCTPVVPGGSDNHELRDMDVKCTIARASVDTLSAPGLLGEVCRASDHLRLVPRGVRESFMASPKVGNLTLFLPNTPFSNPKACESQ